MVLNLKGRKILSDPALDHIREFFRLRQNLLCLCFGRNKGFVVVDNVPFSPTSVKVIAIGICTFANRELHGFKGDPMVSSSGDAITARKLSSSFLDVLCRLTSLLVSNCVQVTLFTFHELTIPVQHICQKVIARGNFSAEFVCRIARHIYFATEAFLDFSQGRR
jgi:hypothetical protein